MEPIKKLDGQAADARSLQVRRRRIDAILPTRGSVEVAGYDLYAIEDAVVPCKAGNATIRTGIIVVLPRKVYGRLAPRSGLAAKYCIDVGAGVIDADFRGEIKVILYNHGG